MNTPEIKDYVSTSEISDVKRTRRVKLENTPFLKVLYLEEVEEDDEEKEDTDTENSFSVRRGSVR